MASAWRQFNFFSSELIKDESNSSLSSPAAIQNAAKGSVYTACLDRIYIGDHNGKLTALDKHFKKLCEVIAYQHGAIQFVLGCANDTILTLGDEDNNSAVVKVWSIRDNKGYSFKLLSTVTVHNDKPFPVTCCRALPDLSNVAVGFADGRVVLIKGDLARDRGAKQRTVYEGEEPITGIEFMSNEKALSLYIFSTSKTLTLVISNISGKAVVQVPRIMESIGAAIGCIVLDPLTNEIVVVRDDAIYVYGVEGRGPCYALEGRKSSIHTFAGYIIVVQPPNEPKTGTLKILGKANISDSIEESSRVMMFEMKNKFIAYNGFFPKGLQSIFSINERLFFLSSDTRLYSLTEANLDFKLDILFSKHMFTLALALVADSKNAGDRAEQVHLKYADHLYSKGDFQGSVNEYITAIRICDTSAVLRKFLQAQHVPLLTQFLEALHTARISNAEYTTLLMNCYAKLKQKDKIEKLIREEGETPIDLDITVALCRQAGYYDQAINLCSKHKNHAMALGIMVEDKKDVTGAFKYIKKMKDMTEVHKILLHFGRILLTHAPADTTRMLIDIYTGTFVTAADVHAAGIMSPPRKASAIYGGAFYESMINNKYSQALPSLPSLDISQFNPMHRIPSIASSNNKEPRTEPASGATSAVGPVDEPKLLPPPQTAFSLFIDFPNEFIQFLEVLLERQTDSSEGQRQLLVSTLLEMYLKQGMDANDPAKWKDKAKSLLVTEADSIDTSNALLLFHLSSFTEGSIMIQERAGRKLDVLRSYCAVQDTPNVIKTLHAYGPEEPHLYTVALRYFITSSEILAEAGTEFQFVLTKINEHRLLSPLQVVQALSTTDVATIGSVKEYLQEQVTKERNETRQYEELINSYAAEIAAKKKELEDFGQTKSIQGTRCARCSAPLDLPVLHFLCGHSFHARCSDPGEDAECIVCADANAQLSRIAQEKAHQSAREEIFKDGLVNAKDKVSYLLSRVDLLTTSSTTT